MSKPRFKKGEKVTVTLEYTGSMWTISVNGIGYGWATTLGAAISKAADYEAEIVAAERIR